MDEKSKVQIWSRETEEETNWKSDAWYEKALGMNASTPIKYRKYDRTQHDTLLKLTWR